MTKRDRVDSNSNIAQLKNQPKGMSEIWKKVAALAPVSLDGSDAILESLKPPIVNKENGTTSFGFIFRLKDGSRCELALTYSKPERSFADRAKKTSDKPETHR